MPFYEWTSSWAQQKLGIEESNMYIKMYMRRYEERILNTYVGNDEEVELKHKPKHQTQTPNTKPKHHSC